VTVALDPTPRADDQDHATLQWPCPDRLRPSAVIIGAQKCGTTSLFKYLREHPRIRAPRTKESRYFDKRWDRGLEWYARQFPRRRPLPGSQTTIDASPASLFDPQAPARAARTLPDATIIVLLRNPIDRAYSHYRHNIRRGRAVDSFEAEIEKEPERVQRAVATLQTQGRYINKDFFHASYLTRGQYAGQIRAWLEHFDPSRTIILQSEAMFADPQRSLDAVTDRLGLPRHRLRNPEAHGFGGAHDPVKPETRAALERYFAPFNRELAELLHSLPVARDTDWPTDGSWPRPG